MSPEPLSNAVLTWIIILGLLGFIGVLWAIAAWSVNRIIKQVDAIPGELKEISTTVETLATNVKDMTAQIKKIQDEQERGEKDKRKYQAFMYDEIEMLRDTRHSLFTFITSVRAKLEATFKVGDTKIMFEEKWELPKMKRESNPFRLED